MIDPLDKFIDYVRFSSTVAVIESGGGFAMATRVAIAAVAGSVTAFFGWKIHKLVIMGAGAAVGAFGGHFLFKFLPGLAPAWVWMIGCAIIGAGLAYGLFHAACALTGAVAGGMVGWVLAAWIMSGSDKAGYGAAIGIVVGGVGAFALNRLFVTLFSGIVGSYALVAAILVVLHKIAPEASRAIPAGEFIPIVWMAAIAAVAVRFQYRKRPPLAEKDESERKKSDNYDKETE